MGIKLQQLRGADYWVIKIDANGNKQWDKTFGGSNADVLYALQQTSDGGYILGGASQSDADGDKTEYSRGNSGDPCDPYTEDYWVVKIDANGNKQWDKTFGGSDNDQLHSLRHTSNGGYILGGNSSSGIGYDKTAANKGGDDYWLVKIDSSGNKQWDMSYGGNTTEVLHSLELTSDGGYILGGYSESDISGDVTAPNKGEGDFWIVKTNAAGTKLWDKTYGGNGTEGCYSLQQTLDGGYIFGGYSNSGINGDKTESNTGGEDCWILKTDVDGNKQWDKTYGGSNYEDLFSLQQTSNRGYILGGRSSSGISGNKTENSRGGADYWIVKVADTTHPDHPKPTICINNVSITEGNSGQTQLKFTISLNETSDQVVKVCYGTRIGTATAMEDYVATSGTLTFAPGAKYQIVTVLVNGDSQCEADETFTVQLSDAVNATIKEGTGTGTILNDDANCTTVTFNSRAIVMAPNPASSVVNLRLNGFSGNTIIQLLSMKGNVLKTFKVQGGSISKQFSVAELPNGTYYLAVSDEHGHQQSTKVIVAH